MSRSRPRSAIKSAHEKHVCLCFLNKKLPTRGPKGGEIRTCGCGRCPTTTTVSVPVVVARSYVSYAVTKVKPVLSNTSPVSANPWPKPMFGREDKRRMGACLK